MKHTKKLVLFDIDGTLIWHVDAYHTPGKQRYIHALDTVFGIRVEPGMYHGMVDRQILYALVAPHGVTMEEFAQKFPLVIDAMHDYAKKTDEKKIKLYRPIDDSVALARKLAKREDIALGLLTGNVERMAWWKLEHAGVPNIFEFGLFGDEADDRIALAKTVFAKAQKHFKQMFTPKQVVVIGDSPGDVRCARAIGAVCIITTAAGHLDPKEFAAQPPDFLVPTLLDPAVLDYFNVIS